MTDLTVPKTILEQLGGNDFIALTGAAAFISTEDSLTFRAGRNPNSVSHVRITLTATDLYAVTFFHTGRAPRIVDEVYCDILQDVFFKHTGLRALRRELTPRARLPSPALVAEAASPARRGTPRKP
jgi:hypothetical protein